MKKRILFIIGIISALIFAIGLFTSYIDSARVRNSVEPKYTIRVVTDDGYRVTYWGLGYKVIRYPSVSPNEPYKNNRGVKMGSWFMKYEIEEENKKVTLDELNDVNNKIIEYFNLNGIKEYKNYSYNYVDEKNRVVIVGLLDNSKEKQEEFKRLVVDSDLIKFEEGEVNVNEKATVTELELKTEIDTMDHGNSENELVKYKVYVKNNKLYAKNLNTKEEKVIFDKEPVKNITTRNICCAGNAHLLILTTNGNVYMSKDDSNYDFTFNIEFNKCDAADIVSFKLIPAADYDFVKNLYGIDSEGNEILLHKMN